MNKLEINQVHPDSTITDIENHEAEYPEWQSATVMTGNCDTSEGDQEKHDYFVRLLAAAPELLDTIIKLGRDLELLSEHYEKDSFITKDLKTAYELHKKVTL